METWGKNKEMRKDNMRTKPEKKRKIGWKRETIKRNRTAETQNGVTDGKKRT